MEMRAGFKCHHWSDPLPSKCKRRREHRRLLAWGKL